MPTQASTVVRTRPMAPPCCSLRGLAAPTRLLGSPLRILSPSPPGSGGPSSSGRALSEVARVTV